MTLGGGNEHDVYFDESSYRVIKITNNPPSYGAQGEALTYLVNLENQNLLLDDALRFEGLLPVQEGYAIVTSQPFVNGYPAPEGEIDRFFSELGYASIGNFSYRTRLENIQITVRDARPDNVFRSAENGLLLPIDVQIFLRQGNAS